MIESFGIEDICPGISTIGINPMIRKDTFFAPNISQMLFSQGFFGKITAEENAKVVWLLRKFMWASFCYAKAYTKFKEFEAERKNDAIFYLNAIEWIEQCISSTYHFQVVYTKGVAYTSGDKDSKWFRLNMCNNTVKHFQESGLSSDINHRTMLTNVGLSNFEYIVTYEDLFQAMIEVEQEAMKLTSNP